MRKIFLGYILVAGVVVGLVVVKEYVDAKSMLIHELGGYENTYISSLAEALGAMDIAKLNKLANSIQQSDHVVGVKILDRGAKQALASAGSVLSEDAGEGISSGLYGRKFPIVYRDQVGTERLAYAEIYTSRDAIVQIIKSRVFIEGIAVLFMMAILWVIVVTVSRRTLDIPLSRLTALTQGLDFSNLDEHREMDITGGKTEIEVFENAFIGMTQRLGSARDELTEFNDDLEKRVEERTAELEKEIAEHVRAKELLRESEERFRELANLIPQPVWEANLKGFFTYSNRSGFKLFGYTQEDLEKGVRVDELFMPEERKRVQENYARILRGKQFDSQEYVCLRKDGSKFPAIAYASRIFRNGKLVGIRGLTIDITERKQTEEKLNKLSRAVEYSSSAVIITDIEHRIEYVNPKFTEISGYSSEEAIGETPQFLQSEHTLGARYDDLFESIATDGEWKGELYNRKKNGSFYWASNSISGIRDKHGVITHYISILDDVTQEIELKEQISFQASHDVLTGLINRREFERRAERLISTFQQGQDDHALCFMDLDQFKVINDTCGHTAGDELLRQLGEVLQSTVRQRDTLARLGGDEFGVLMEHCSLDQARRVAETLASAVSDFHFPWEGHLFRISASIGLVAINELTPTLTELLRQADAACYMAKDLGRNRIHMYHSGDSEMAQRQGEMQWVARINRALEDDRFTLYAQPIVPLDASGARHFELLLRMIDENGEIIPPGAFLPAAERYDLIGLLDHWVVKNTFALLTDNPDFVAQIDLISINLSGQSLSNGAFLEFIIANMESCEIAPNKICFEVTETVAISNLAAASAFISILRDLGCRFALDDFGSGLSSFGYLKSLPVDYLKIDGMFVRDMVDDPIDHAMVKSINDIGQVMGMETIAEFVENDEIKGMLREIGVNYAQGYGVGKPQPLDEILGLPILGPDVSRLTTTGETEETESLTGVKSLTGVRSIF
ncbi:MAG: EAL domain-containing protein [Gammaproteobacteria bacterium]